MRRRWRDEPLVHFVLLGAGLFLAERWIAPRAPEAVPAADPDGPIVVTADFVQGLETEELRRSGESLDAAAREAAIARFVEDEALYREALARSLDAGDPVVRLRLVQKMRFVLDGEVPPPTPTDAALEAFLAERADRYRLPERVSFTHIFFSRNERGAAARDDAARMLASLAREEPPPLQAGDRGDPFLFQSDFPRKSRTEVERAFGAAFADALDGLAEGRWTGPVASVYGEHLVLVTERLPAGLPALAEIREAVRSDWERSTREAEMARAVAEIVARHRVERRDRVEAAAR